jgi:hypothetical protein
MARNTQKNGPGSRKKAKQNRRPRRSSKKLTAPEGPAAKARAERGRGEEPGEGDGSRRPAPESTSRDAPGAAERGSRATTRPVARSLEPPKKEKQPRQSVGALILAGAALVAAGVYWVTVVNKDREPAQAVLAAQLDQQPPSAAQVARQPAPAEPAAQQRVPAEVSRDTDTEQAIADSPGPDLVVHKPDVPQPAAQPRPAPARAVVTRAAAPPTPAASADPEPPQAKAELKAAEAVAEPDKLEGFSRRAAWAALQAAAREASSCRQQGDPTGMAHVRVTFAPSGRVTSALIDSGPFVGTPTGSCIAKTMRRMTIPPFAGEHVTVSRTVTIM